MSAKGKGFVVGVAVGVALYHAYVMAQEKGM